MSKAIENVEAAQKRALVIPAGDTVIEARAI
jgi:hypothetical protein